jgi:hypothetical protein
MLPISLRDRKRNSKRAVYLDKGKLNQDFEISDSGTF